MNNERKKRLQNYLIKRMRTLTEKSDYFFQDEIQCMRRANQILMINGQGDINKLSSFDLARYRAKLEDIAEARALCRYFLNKALKWDELICKKRLANSMVHNIIEFQSELGILRLRLNEISQELNKTN